MKGNKERRKELSQKRKEGKRDEIIRKKSGPANATPEEVRARLLSDFHIRRGEGIVDPELIAWVVLTEPEDGTTNGRKNICESWLRTGSCPLKRCRHSHDITISHLVNSSSITLEDEGEGLRFEAGLPPLTTQSLHTVEVGGGLSYDRNLRTQVRTVSLLRFISQSSRLLFDYADPTVFATYVEEQSRTTNACKAFIPDCVNSVSSAGTDSATVAPMTLANVELAATIFDDKDAMFIPDRRKFSNDGAQ